jgi:hypothetical protein
MATQHASDEPDIRKRMGRLPEAIRAMDLESVMAIYAPDIASRFVSHECCRACQLCSTRQL